ncbi:tail fiber assembly protein [Escherichia coli]|uniref:tail fiber assembly protein n=4 Tax=Escherichia coli TaxID=562 RepID=UPI000BE25F62|nr:tail fiber assembly protein [Escherichia coli]EFA4172320.1 tail fiber assembly protein [Escherichia coli O163]EFC7365729.1 tail fiber assembly protein [Escherichia coli]EFH6890789.1 tail fiber assembly protein [Escherichia coli]EFJ1937052.1 tail fiber assembly protein [Escherichia coli]EFM6058249.1 tail fiber assembly protein [Escherichia coli]
MMHLRGFTAGQPKTQAQYQLTKRYGVIWLYDKDGKNWYEEQKNFQEDTIKIAYDENNTIVAITKDASTLNPEGLSVVEVPDITANRRADISGNWMFKDGKVLPVPVDYHEQAESKRQTLLAEANDATADWRTELALGILDEADKQRLTQWMNYIRQLKALSLETVVDKASNDAIKWPQPPSG